MDIFLTIEMTAEQAIDSKRMATSLMIGKITRVTKGFQGLVTETGRIGMANIPGQNKEEVIGRDSIRMDGASPITATASPTEDTMTGETLTRERVHA